MKKIVAILLAINTVFLSGCWDQREINELGLVMAVGVDRKKGDRLFTVTAQIAKPSDAAGQGGKSGGGGGEPVWVGSAKGKTIFEAVRNIAKSSSRRVMWAHNNIIIIGEELAEQDITPVVDFFTQNHELRMKTWVAVSHGDAKPFVSAKTGIENIPGISLAELFRYHELPSESVATDMVTLFRDYKSETKQPLVAGLTMQKGDEGVSSAGRQIELEGAAVFKGSKMIGWTSAEETRGIAWLRNEMKNSVIVVSPNEKDDQKASVELRNTKVKISARVQGDIPSITVNISAKGDIAEIDYPTDKEIGELKTAVENETSYEIKREVKLALEKVQKGLKSDVLGFGRYVHIANKDEWYKRLDEKWQEIYPQVPVEINVSLDLDSSALYQVPLGVDNRKSRD